MSVKLGLKQKASKTDFKNHKNSVLIDSCNQPKPYYTKMRI